MFNFFKAVGKFLLGAVGVGAGLLATNPQVITSHLPQAAISMGVGGLVVEVLDWLHNYFTKQA